MFVISQKKTEEFTNSFVLRRRGQAPSACATPWVAVLKGKEFPFIGHF